MRALIYIIAFFTLIFSQSLSAQTAGVPIVYKEIPVLQSIQSADSSKGKIQLRGDTRINELVKRRAASSEAASGIDGWRIQIYNSSGRVARDEANDERTRFLNKYPDLKAYLIYQPPYFKIRVGDYRTKQEAYKMYKQIVKQFPVSYLVPDNINLPELNIYSQK